jgi:hypothetical protein
MMGSWFPLNIPITANRDEVFIQKINKLTGIGPFVVNQMVAACGALMFTFLDFYRLPPLAS